MKINKELIKKFRTENMYSIRDFASLVGITPSTVMRIEKTGNTTTINARKLAIVINKNILV